MNAASVALDPHFNIRLFAAGSPAALLAAGTWMNTRSPVELGAWNVLIDSVEPEIYNVLSSAAATAGVLGIRSETRCRLSGTPAQLFDLSGMLLGQGAAALGSELRASCSAYQSALYRRERTLVMGILNVTPDSFSDGGLLPDVEAAVARGLEMVAAGADIIDIGGESTRPGAAEVPADEELKRVLPVVERLREETNALLSIDTRKAAVAGPCLEAGADWINDVSGLTHDPALADVVAAHPGTVLILMHSRAKPVEERFSNEYDEEGRPVYEDVVGDTARWLRRQAQQAIDAGIPSQNLWIDPGFGFGKTPEQNLDLLRRLREYTAIGLPILVGTSRKSTLGGLLGGLPPEQRGEATAATVAWAIAQGAAAVRVHDVREMHRVARVADALR